MPIQAVKEHISQHFTVNLISRHYKYHFANLDKEKSIKEDQNIKIRKFSIEDTDKSAKLYQEVFNDYPWYDKWNSINQIKKYLSELIENPVFEGFVAIQENEILGVCFGYKRSWWMGKEFFINEFYVSPKKQGNGIGTKLIDYIKDSLTKEDYNRLILLTDKGIPAENFYIKNGFYINQNRINMIKELKQ